MNLKLIWAAICNRAIVNKISVVDGTVELSGNNAVICHSYFCPISDKYKAFITKQMRLLQRLPAHKQNIYVEKEVFAKLLRRGQVAIRMKSGPRNQTRGKQ